MGLRSKHYTSLIIWVFPILFGLMTEVHTGFEFTNLKCIAVDEKYCELDYCYLKSINRTYKYASAKLILHLKPVNNIIVQVTLMKRLNGYKPFLYNFTVDFCNYMKNPNAGYKVAAFFHDLLEPYSNINHTCPYTDDVIVDKLPISFLNVKLTKTLPFPEGDYRVTANMIVHRIIPATLMIFFRIY